MDVKDIRKFLLWSFIGFLVFTALIAVFTVLSGEAGDTRIRILGTTFTISIASICAMSCVAFIEKKRFKPAGMAGIFFALLSAILIIIEIWAETNSEWYFKTTITIVVCAFSFAHSLLLFLPVLDPGKEWIQKVTACTIGILAVQIIIVVWYQPESQIYFRVLTAIAIIAGLETLVIPVLMKLRKGDKQTVKKEKLLLEKVDHELYKNQEGEFYEVRKLTPVEYRDKK